MFGKWYRIKKKAQKKFHLTRVTVPGRVQDGKWSHFPPFFLTLPLAPVLTMVRLRLQRAATELFYSTTIITEDKRGSQGQNRDSQGQDRGNQGQNRENQGKNRDSQGQNRDRGMIGPTPNSKHPVKFLAPKEEKPMIQAPEHLFLVIFSNERFSWNLNLSMI